MINLLKEVLRLNKRFVSEHFAAAKLKENTLKKIQEITAQGNDLKLEIGAGEKKGKNGWITLDMYAGCDIQWDLINGIPFPDNSISKIYSSHLFEHLTFKETAGLMKECLRVLKPEGQFLICVPNSRLYIEAYMKNDTDFRKEHPFFQPAWNNTTKIDLINYIAYMDGHHKYMFDEENLLAVLEKNGFRNATFRNFDPEIDLKERDHESLYAEGVK
jgi:predicted SAM-dependent methyltransferase